MFRYLCDSKPKRPSIIYEAIIFWHRATVIEWFLCDEQFNRLGYQSFEFFNVGFSGSEVYVFAQRYSKNILVRGELVFNFCTINIPKPLRKRKTLPLPILPKRTRSPAACEVFSVPCFATDPSRARAKATAAKKHRIDLSYLPPQKALNISINSLTWLNTISGPDKPSSVSIMNSYVRYDFMALNNWIIYLVIIKDDYYILSVETDASWDSK